MAKTSTSGQGRPRGALNRATKSVRELAGKHSPAAINTLVGIMDDITAPPASRVAAAKELLDRAHGRPSASVSISLPDTGIADQAAFCVSEAAAGRISLDNLTGLMSGLTAQARITETGELMQRLESLEELTAKVTP